MMSGVLVMYVCKIFIVHTREGTGTIQTNTVLVDSHAMDKLR